MKKFLYIALFALVFVSCSKPNEVDEFSIKSPAQRAKVLIKKHIKNYLFHPDTYEGIETKIDSAFTPYCDPTFHRLLLKLKEITNEIDEYDLKINLKKNETSSAESIMTLYSDMYYGYSALSQHQYQRYKQEYETHNRELQDMVAEKDSLVVKKRKLNDKIREAISKQPKFIGWQAIHRYRAENNLEQTLIGNAYFLFDEDFREVLLMYDVDSDDFNFIDKMIREFKEENI